MKCLRTSVTKEKTLVEEGESKFQEVSTSHLWASSSELSVSEVMRVVPVVAHLSLLASSIIPRTIALDNCSTNVFS